MLEKFLFSRSIINRILLLLFLLTIIGLPYSVLLILKEPSNNGVGSNDAWIAFYGAYFGAIVSGIITLIVIKINLYLKEREERKSHVDYVRGIVSNYLPNIEVILMTAINSIECEKASESDVYHIPQTEIFFDDSYFVRMLETNMEFNDKYEFVALFHKLKGIQFLSERAVATREQQNMIMTYNNLNSLNFKVLAVSLKMEPDDIVKIYSGVDGMYSSVVHPMINSQTEEYYRIARNALSLIHKLKEKYRDF